MANVMVLTGQLERIILKKVGTRLHPEDAVCFTLVTMKRQYRWSSNVQTSILSDRLGNAKPPANCSAKLNYQTIQNGAKFTIKWNVRVTFPSLPFSVFHGSRLFCNPDYQTIRQTDCSKTMRTVLTLLMCDNISYTVDCNSVPMRSHTSVDPNQDLSETPIFYSLFSSTESAMLPHRTSYRACS